MVVRAIGRYLGFSSEHHPAESEDTQTVDQSDPPSDRSRGGIRRALLRSTFALVLFSGLLATYQVGKSQGIEQAQDETGGFIRPTPTGPTEPEAVADLLSRYGLACDETLVVHELSDWMRHSYVCPVESQWFELDIHHQSWQVFRTLDLVGHGMACIPLTGTRHLNWWTVHRDDWLVILHDPVVAGRLANIPGATVSEGRCAREVTGQPA